MNIPGDVRGGEFDVHDKMMRLASQPVPLHDVVGESALGGHTFERFQLGDLVLQLLLETAEFRDRAMSYRDFNVAAGAWCLDYPRYGRMLGYNVKVDDTDLVNIHAEDLVTEKAAAEGFQEISILAVIGPTQEDHASGKHTETLHPCGRCRGRLAQSELVSDRTLVVTARPDFTVVELASLSDIVGLHQDGDKRDMTTFRFDQTPAILRPRLWEPGQDAVPRRVEEIDSSDYDSSIGAFLTKRFFEMQQTE